MSTTRRAFLLKREAALQTIEYRRAAKGLPPDQRAQLALQRIRDQLHELGYRDIWGRDRDR